MADDATAALRLPVGSFDRQRGRGAHDLAFGITAQVLQMGSGLILLPIVIATLTTAEVGFWYVFMTIQTMVYLIDFGFIPTFSRNFNYVFSGADRIEEHGLPPAPKSHVNLVLLGDLLATSRRIYLWITLVTVVILAPFGTVYMARLVEQTPMDPSIWWDWAIFVAVLVGHTYFQWQIVVLNGSGRIRQTYDNAILTRSVQVIASIVGLMIHPTLTTLVIAYALSAVVMRLHLFFCMRDILKTIHDAVGHSHPRMDLLATIWRNTYRYGAVLVASFLGAKFSTLVIAWFFGVEISASFAIAAQALSAVVGVSHVLSTMAFPRIVRAKVAGDFETTRSLLSACLVFMVVVVICGSIALVTLGPYILSLIGKSTSLPPVTVLVLMCVAYLIESILQMLTTAITADNKIPFVRAYIVSGTLIAVGLMVAGSANLRLEAFLLIQIFVQCAYNAWKWPSMALADCRLKLSEIPAASVRGLALLLKSH